MLSKFGKKLFRLLLIYLVAINAVYVPKEAYAIYEGERDVNWSSSKKRCEAPDLEFDPFMSNPDINWELDNSICITYVATTGAMILAAEQISSYNCGLAANAVEAAAQKASGVPMSPDMIKRRVQESGACSTFLSAQNYGQAAACCGSMAATLISTGIAVAALAIIYAAALGAYHKARICGHDWLVWAKIDENGNESSSGDWKHGSYSGSQKKCRNDLFMNSDNSCNLSNTTRDITNKYYREFIYGGIEFEDQGTGACSLPSTWDSARKIKILGDDSFSNIPYYMNGPGQAPVYACYRFSGAVEDEADREAMQIAYDCCKLRSQAAVCIQNSPDAAGSPDDYKTAFCEIGQRCNVSGIWFDAYASMKEPNYACVKTYSVCPYNHLLGGGTEDEVIDSSNTSLVKNYCQVMNHCSKVPILPYVRTSSLEGAFISSACRDMKGDSQNSYGYTAELIPINTKGFTAPMSQCFKETMENLFLNVAGDTKCKNPDESPDSDGECVSGYEYKKGQTLAGKSFFQKIQDALQDAIKMALTLSILFFGFVILLGLKPIDKKTLLLYIIKIGLVMYFAVGDAWQGMFMRGVLGTSGFLADLVFKVDESAPANKLDGCQFPRFYYADPDNTFYPPAYNTNDAIRLPAYPPGKEYLRIWDTFDCKIARALGFGPEVSVPNLVMMILGGFLTGGLGIVFVVGSFLFAFFLISIAVRALHVFLLSITAVILMLYVSPLIITCALFTRSKSLFDKWWKELLSYTLQPMILFAYLAILITLFDKTVIGDVTFSGNGADAPKEISCSGDAADTSIYCIFGVADIKTYPGFEVVGIGLPMLASMNETKMMTIFKSGLIMFIFTKFLDQISAVTTALIGGTGLGGGWNMSMGQMAGKAYSTMRGVQQRGMRALKKHGGAVARKGIDTAKSVGEAVGNRGKSVAEAKRGGNETGSTAKEGGETESTTSENETGSSLQGENTTTREGGAEEKPKAEAEEKEKEETEEKEKAETEEKEKEEETTGRTGDEALQQAAPPAEPEKPKEEPEKPKEEPEKPKEATPEPTPPAAETAPPPAAAEAPKEAPPPAAEAPKEAPPPAAEAPKEAPAGGGDTGGGNPPPAAAAPAAENKPEPAAAAPVDKPAGGDAPKAAAAPKKSGGGGNKSYMNATSASKQRNADTAKEKGFDSQNKAKGANKGGAANELGTAKKASDGGGGKGGGAAGGAKKGGGGGGAKGGSGPKGGGGPAPKSGGGGGAKGGGGGAKGGGGGKSGGGAKGGGGGGGSSGGPKKPGKK